MTSRGWLILFACTTVGVGIAVAVKASQSKSVSGVASGVDLDQVIDTFREAGGQKDLKAFEAAVNAKNLYPNGVVSVAWNTARPGILGFVDKNGNGVYDRGLDTFVFELQIERPTENEYRVIAYDGTYYRYHPIIGNLAAWYVADSLMTALWFRHYSVYAMGPRTVYHDS